MSCSSNSSDINQTFIIDTIPDSSGSLTGCTGVFTNFITNCSGDTVTFGTNIFTNNQLSANTVNAEFYFSGGSPLRTGVINIITGQTSGVFLELIGGTMTGPLFGTTISATSISATTLYGDGSHLTGLNIIVTGTTNQISANTVSGITTLSLTPDVHISGNMFIGSSSSLQFGDNGIGGSITGFITAVSDGVFRIGDSSGGGSPKIILGSIGSGFVALKRNGAGLQVRLGDDSGYASLTASTYYGSGANLTGISDSRITGLTYSNNNILITDSSGGTFSALINVMTGLTISGDALVIGNVTILGTATTINTQTLSVKDNLITLNNNATGSTAPFPIDSGLEILRNSATTATLIWNELSREWQVGVTGSTYGIITKNSSLSDLAITAHTHPINQIIGLQAALDSKLNISGGTITGTVITNVISATTISANTISSSRIPNGSIVFATTGSTGDVFLSGSSTVISDGTRVAIGTNNFSSKNFTIVDGASSTRVHIGQWITDYAGIWLNYGGVNTLNPTTKPNIAGAIGGNTNIYAPAEIYNFPNSEGSGSMYTRFTSDIMYFMDGQSGNAIANLGRTSATPNFFTLNTFFGGNSSATGYVHLGAGTTTTPQLKLTSGNTTTTPQSGATEYDGRKLYFTNSGTSRNIIAQVSGETGLSNTRIPYTAPNGMLTDIDMLTFNGNRMTIGKTGSDLGFFYLDGWDAVDRVRFSMNNNGSFLWGQGFSSTGTFIMGTAISTTAWQNQYFYYTQNGKFGVNTTPTGATVEIKGSGNTTNKTLRIVDSGLTESFSVTDAGTGYFKDKIGAGISPSYRIHSDVTGLAGTSRYGLIVSNGTSEIGLWSNGSQPGLGTKSNSPLYFFVNDGSTLGVFDTTGKFAIGSGIVASSGAKFHIQGTGTGTSKSIQAFQSDNTTESFNITDAGNASFKGRVSGATAIFGAGIVSNAEIVDIAGAIRLYDIAGGLPYGGIAQSSFGGGGGTGIANNVNGIGSHIANTYSTLINQVNGNILFQNSLSTSGSVNWAERMRVDVNGNVSIGGVSTPLAKFEIKGSGSTNSKVIRTVNSASTETFSVTDSGYANILSGLTVPVISGSTNAGADLILLSTGNPTKGKIYLGSGSKTYYNETNTSLILSSSANVTDTVGDAGILVHRGTASTTLGLSRFIRLQDQTGVANDRLEIGFGYNNQAGNTSYSPGIIGSKLLSSAGSTNASLYFATRQSTSDIVPTVRFLISENGNISIGNGENTSAASVEIKGSGNTTNKSFRTINSASTETFSVTDAGNGYFASGLTIGLASGTTALINAETDINKIAEIIIRGTANDTNNYAQLRTFNSSGKFVGIGMGGISTPFGPYAGTAYVQSDTSLLLSAGNDGSSNRFISFATVGVSSEIARFTSAGRLLIGSATTTTTAAKLEITTANAAYGWLHTNGPVQLASYIDSGTAFIGTTTNNSFDIFTNNGASRFRISAAGNGSFSSNLYIGDVTGVASSRLQIKGTGTGSTKVIQVFQSDGTTESFSVTDAGNGNFKSSITGTAVTLTASNTTNSVILDPTGGIFHINPSSGNIANDFAGSAYWRLTSSINAATYGTIRGGSGGFSAGMDFSAYNDATGGRIMMYTSGAGSGKYVFNATNSLTSSDIPAMVRFGANATATSIVQIGGDLTISSWGTTGTTFSTLPSIYTDSSAAGTRAAANINSFGISRIAKSAAVTGITITDAATVYIDGAPITGSTGTTITNAWGLWNKGKTKLEGDVVITGAVSASTINSNVIINPSINLFNYYNFI